MTNKLIPIPTHTWRCEECDEHGSMFEEDQLIKCPKCGSSKIDSGPIIHGGPIPQSEEWKKH